MEALLKVISKNGDIKLLSILSSFFTTAIGFSFSQAISNCLLQRWHLDEDVLCKNITTAECLMHISISLKRVSPSLYSLYPAHINVSTVLSRSIKYLDKHGRILSEYEKNQILRKFRGKFISIVVEATDEFLSKTVSFSSFVVNSDEPRNDDSH